YAVRGFMVSRRRRAGTTPPEAPGLAAALLRTLLAEKPECHWRYMARVGRALRPFLWETCAVPGRPEGGTGRMFADAMRGRLPEALAGDVHDALCRIDDAVSDEMDEYPEMEAFRAAVRGILEFGEAQAQWTSRTPQP
ncbi:hypothetical protein, partial [Desulfococcus sp.]|uniref:hypothetical protein n=1 Tax=Desulfococcus sp. TaxID=2025834 RepID=UPI003592F6DE